MPSHLTAATYARAVTSTGERVTLVQWRANRLADAVARRCANARVPDHEALKTAVALMRAIRAETAALGAVTHAANNHCVTVTVASGATTTVTRRDSARTARPADVPARPWRKRLLAPPPEPRLVALGAVRPTSQSRPARAVARLAAANVRVRSQRAASDLALRSALTDKHACATPAAVDGTSRFLALRARIAARAANAPGGACQRLGG